MSVPILAEVILSNKANKITSDEHCHTHEFDFHGKAGEEIAGVFVAAFLTIEKLWWNYLRHFPLQRRTKGNCFTSHNIL